MAAVSPKDKPAGVPRWLQILGAIVALCGGVLFLVTNGRNYFGVHDVRITPSFVPDNMLPGADTLTFSVSNFGTRQAVLQAAYISFWTDAVVVTSRGTANGGWGHAQGWGKEVQTASGIPLTLSPGDTKTIRLLLPEPTSTASLEIGLDTSLVSDAQTYNSTHSFGAVSHPDLQARKWLRIDRLSQEPMQLINRGFDRPPHR